MELEETVKKSIAVLGLGMFGRSLVRALSELGADVLAVDVNEGCRLPIYCH